MSADSIDPVVASIVGDISDLLAKIAEAQGAMAEFAGSAPAMEFDPGAMAGTAGAAEQTAAAMAEAEQAAAMSADELAEAIQGPLAVTDEEIQATIVATEELAAASGELAAELEVVNAAAEELVVSLAEVTAAEDAAGRGADDAGSKTKAAGDAARDASTNWMMLGLAAAAVEFGIGGGVLALSAAVVGIGYLISDFGGEAKGDLQEVEGAFRDTASQAAQAWAPALQEITQGLTSTVRDVEPQMSAMFSELQGPAEQFFAGLDQAAEQGMSALVPAIAQMGPLISSITSDLGPLAQGAAEFGQDMSQAFEAGGGQQGLAQLAQEIGQLLPVLGQLVGEMGAGLLPIAEALTPVLEGAANVLNALGPNFITVAGGAYLAYQAWQQINSVSGSLINGLEKLSGWLATDAVEQTEVGVTAEEATVGLEAEAVAAEEAGLAFAAAAIEMLPIVAAAAAVGLAAYELIDHWSDVVSFFQNLIAESFTWGENLVSGIGQGIESTWQTVIQPIETLVSGVENEFRTGFGIFSPSTMTREFGQNLGQGAALGIFDSIGGVEEAASSMTTRTMAAFGSGAAVAPSFGYAAPSAGGGSGGGGQTIVNLTVNVTSPFGTPPEVAEAVMSAVQQLNINNGTSMLSHNGLKGTST